MKRAGSASGEESPPILQDPQAVVHAAIPEERPGHLHQLGESGVQRRLAVAGEVHGLHAARDPGGLVGRLQHL